MSDTTSTEQPLIDSWLSSKAPLTRANYRREIERFSAFTGKPLKRITTADIERYRASLSSLSLATQATRTRTVKSLFTYLHRSGYLETNPGHFVHVDRRPMQQLTPRILREDDIQRMIDAEPNERNRLLMRLLYLSGCRVSEVAGARVGDCRSVACGGELFIFGKGLKQRVIALPFSLWRDIRPLLHQADDSYLFPSPCGGGLKRRRLSDIVKRAAIRVGLHSDVSPHWLRHSSASHALNNGAPAHVVRRDLGHGSLFSTTLYAHADGAGCSSDFLRIG